MRPAAAGLPLSLRPRLFRPTLRQTIGLLLSGTILLLAAALTTHSYHASRLTLLSLSQSVVERNHALVREAVMGFLRSVQETVRTSAALLGDGVLGQDRERLETYLYHAMQARPYLSKMGYGDSRGGMVLLSRQPDGSLATKTITVEGGRRVRWRHRAPGRVEPTREEEISDDDFDPRARPWYRGAVDAGGLHVTDVYVFHSDRQPGVTAAMPVRASGGAPGGVVFVDVNLLDLSRFLGNAGVGRSAYAFLLSERGELIASSTPGEDLHHSETLHLRTLAESTRPEVRALAAEPVRLEGSERGALHHYQSNGHYAAALLPLRVDGQKRWTLGILTLEDEILADARQTLLRNLLVAGLLALLGLLGGGLVARLIARSLTSVIRETDRVRRLEFAPSRHEVVRFREVQDVLQAFEGMKAGLRAFQKYVPLGLVRSLVDGQREPQLGGESRELTMFFSDIRGFTGLSEALPAAELADKLARYLSVVTAAIHAREGTVDKYIGDGVMAFWGAPSPLADHARAACLAALDCQEQIHALSRHASDMPEFPTRIGLHTAEVLVGNFGSAERFNYTVLGDGVNVASRLENLCGRFGVEILISESTHRHVAPDFVTRRLGQVTVRGRERPLWVYELVGLRGQVPERRVQRSARYEQALALLQEERRAEAEALLATLVADWPEDAASQQLLARCRDPQDAAPTASDTPTPQAPSRGPAAGPGRG